MHQQSHRILRWMDEGRPHSKDLFELFGILITAVPLKVHRVRLQKRYHSLTTYDALHNLENLKFSHANKRPSPDDIRVSIVTNLTTTYSMVPEMARMLCDTFLAARLWESCENKTDFLSGDSVWQLTPKSINLLQTFANRHGVSDRHVQDVIDSPQNNLHLLVLERDWDSDRVIQDPATVAVIFRRFAGLHGPNNRNATNGSDSESITDISNGLAGIKLISKRIGTKQRDQVFTGKAAMDWLMDCCTFVNEGEALQIAAQFVSNGFIELLSDLKDSKPFSASKNAIYGVTSKGRKATKWDARSSESSPNGDFARINNTVAGGRDSNKVRLSVILTTPSLRMLFREFLRDTHCEENLVFYTEVNNFLANWERVYKEADHNPSASALTETLASSYDFYNSFLAPASPCELNIDHSLRFAVMRRMTKSEASKDNLVTSVLETVELFREAKSSVFKLMASDSVPKFLRDSRYSDFVMEQQIDEPKANGGIVTHTVQVATAI